jgi:hypothetical protein
MRVVRHDDLLNYAIVSLYTYFHCRDVTFDVMLGGLAAQRIKQGAQVVVVEFVHQGDQAAQLAGRETFACEPAQVMAGQIGDLAAFVFTVRHFTGQQEGEFFRIHARDFTRPSTIQECSHAYCLAGADDQRICHRNNRVCHRRLLPTIAADLGVNLPSAGLLVSLYALGVAVGAPVLTA